MHNRKLLENRQGAEYAATPPPHFPSSDSGVSAPPSPLPSPNHWITKHTPQTPPPPLPNALYVGRMMVQSSARAREKVKVNLISRQSIPDLKFFKQRSRTLTWNTSRLQLAGGRRRWRTAFSLNQSQWPIISKSIHDWLSYIWSIVLN